MLERRAASRSASAVISPIETANHAAEELKRAVDDAGTPRCCRRVRRRGGTWIPKNVAPVVVAAIFIVLMLVTTMLERQARPRRLTVAEQSAGVRHSHKQGLQLQTVGSEDESLVTDAPPAEMPQLWKHRSSPDAAWDCLEALACLPVLPPHGAALPAACPVGAEAWFRAQPQGGGVLLVQVAAWTGLWGAAWGALAMRQPRLSPGAAASCRSSTFPVRAANEQFAASAYMGSTQLQRRHGFSVAPLHSYEGGALAVELQASTLCSIGAAVLKARARPSPPVAAPKAASGGGGTGPAHPPGACSDLSAAGASRVGGRVHYGAAPSPLCILQVFTPRCVLRRVQPAAALLQPAPRPCETCYGL